MQETKVGEWAAKKMIIKEEGRRGGRACVFLNRKFRNKFGGESSLNGGLMTIEKVSEN
jgi:hypothetical protein